MQEKRKVISGLKPQLDFSWEEREEIVKEYLNSDCSKREIWEKYTGRREEKGRLLDWIRKLGYEELYLSVKSIPIRMPQNKVDKSFENLQLKKRLAELEEELKEVKMRAVAYSTMVDIAEKEFNIPIRKKYNTKPSKR